MSKLIDSERFKKLFPFHIAIDQNFHIYSLGKSIAKMPLQITENVNFHDVLKISYPVIPPTFNELISMDGNIFKLSSLKKNIEFKGEVVFEGSSKLIIFLCDPIIRKLEDIAAMGIKLSDFSNHSQVTDYMFMLQTEQKMKESLTESLKKLSVLNNKLQSSEQHYHTLFETAHDMIHMIDAEGRIVDVNQACQSASKIDPSSASKFDPSKVV